MRQFFRMALAGALLLLSGKVYSQEANRLPPLWEESIRQGRCAGTPLPPEICAAGQETAKSTCALNQTEIDFMVANGVFPSCFSGFLISVCSCGCFDKNTKIAMSQQGKPFWQEVSTIRRDQKIFALAEEASLSQVRFQETGLLNVVKGPESVPLYAISAANGKEIKLSQHHGVLLSDGRVVTAKELKIGDELVTVAGKNVAITSIERKAATDGQVYNVLTDRNTKAGHLIGANGFIVGDLQWQNSFGNEIGAIAVRK